MSDIRKGFSQRIGLFTQQGLVSIVLEPPADNARKLIVNIMVKGAGSEIGHSSIGPSGVDGQSFERIRFQPHVGMI